MESAKSREVGLSRAGAVPTRLRDRPATIGANAFWLALVAIVLAGATFRAWNLGGADMWTDEVLSAQRIGGSLDNAFDSMLSAGNQAPLYYLVMRPLPHDTRTLLRLPAMLLGLVNIAQLALVVTLIYGDRLLGLQTAALLAVSPLHILLSRTARFYTLLLLLALLAAYCFVLLVRGHRSRRVWAVYILSTALAYLTHYTALGLAGTQFLFLLLMLRHERLFIFRWMIAQVVAALPWVIWILLAARGYQDETNFKFIPQLPQLIDIPITFTYLLTGYEGVFHWYFVPALLVSAAGLLAGALYAVRQRRTRPIDFYWLILAVVPVLVLFVMSVTVYGKYKDRYFVTLMPAVFVLFLLGWRRLAPRLVPVALVIVLLTSTYQIVRILHSGEYERTDWSSATAYLQADWQPGDAVLFARWTTYEAFRYAFDGDPHIVDQAILFSDVPNPRTYEPDAARLWIVHRTDREDFHRQGWTREFDLFQPGVSQLGDWLIRHRANVIDVKQFQGLSVILVETP